MEFFKFSLTILDVIHILFFQEMSEPNLGAFNLIPNFILLSNFSRSIFMFFLDLLVYLFIYLFIYFRGVVSIDVELSSIDINQCDAQDSKEEIGDGKKGKSDRTGSTDSVKLLEFMGTHKCKKSTKVINPL